MFCLVFLFLVSLPQLGPFVDSKHEQIEVSGTETVFFLFLSVHNARGNLSRAFLHKSKCFKRDMCVDKNE